MADIQSGQIFSPGDEVTDTKLNNIAGAATILPAFLTGKSSLALNGADGAVDLLLVYDASSAVFKKITPNDLFFNADALMTGRSVDASPEQNDYVLTYDASAGAYKKVAIKDIVIPDTAYTAPKGGDIIPIWDSVGAALKYITIGDLVYYLPVQSAPEGADRLMIWANAVGEKARHLTLNTLINGAVDLGAAAADADEFAVYDASAAAFKKVNAKNLRAYVQAGVASTTKTDTFTSTTSPAWTDITGLSVSITPKNTGSKVLVRASVNAASDTNCYLRLVRDATPIAVGAAAGSRLQAGSSNLWSASGAGNMIFCASMEYLDSPASASALTYKIQFCLPSAGNVYVNRTKDDTDTSAYGRVASTITVVEVGQ